MAEETLFEAATQSSEPLAVRLRPRTLDEVVGQAHLTGPGTPLRRLVEGGGTTSLLLWGPPGTGKTTLAYVVAGATKRAFRELSAVTAGVKDVRAVIDEAKNRLSGTGERTVLFVDEVHRFSKTQQDALLPAVERGTVTMVAATTENPFFSVVAPLLSRSLVLTLEPLTDDDIRTVLRRALEDPRGYRGTLTLPDDAEEHLVRIAGGDARKSLTALEAAAESVLAAGGDTLVLETVEQAVDRAALRYDREGDQHYDVVSAFIKSIRGSDPDAALHYLARMIEAGEDPRFIARRLVVHASEDIGMADPTAIQVAVAAAQALELIGLPEARINLAQATIHLATAPKSNGVIMAINAAQEDVRAGRGGAVPTHLRDAHYPGARALKHGAGYRYPHDEPAGVLRQQYPPDDLVGRNYYTPAGRGAEAPLVERLARLRAVVRGESPPQQARPAAPAGEDGARTPDDPPSSADDQEAGPA